MDFKEIIKLIKKDQCVLLIGSELPFTLNDLDRQQATIKYLQENGFPNPMHFKDDDFYFILPQQKVKFQMKVSEIYETIDKNQLYTKIAQIPFSLIISVSPDNFLQNTYSELFGDRSFDYAYYKKKENNRENIINNKPTKEHPAIYNLFGDISDDDSLILTFNDLFDYFSSIFGERPVTENVQLKLKDAKNFIFIGFKFQAWYYKLLMRILEIDENKINYCINGKTPENQDITKNDKVSFFYGTHFNMDFSNLNVKEFINELHKYCEENNLLRLSLTNTSLNIGSFKDFISNNEIEKAIDLLSVFFSLNKNHVKENTFLLIRQDLSDIRQKEQKGTLSEEQKKLQIRLLCDGLLDLGSSLYNSK